MYHGWRGRMGVIMPDNNTVIEPELYSVLPQGISLHGSRAIMRGVAARERVPTAFPMLPQLIEGLRRRVGVLAYACMTTSIVSPVGWDSFLEEPAEGVPVLTAGETMLKALEAVSAKSVGVFSPFMDDVASEVPAWFSQFGIEVVKNVNVPFSRDQVTSHSLEEFYPLILREFRSQGIDALAILATDISTFAVIDDLEADLGVPVISSNMALLWCMLGELGIKENVGVGTLFGLEAPRRA
jgi:maleate isomerase